MVQIIWLRSENGLGDAKREPIMIRSRSAKRKMLDLSKKLRKWLLRMSRDSSGVKSSSLVKHKDCQQPNDWDLTIWLPLRA